MGLRNGNNGGRNEAHLKAAEFAQPAQILRDSSAKATKATWCLGFVLFVPFVVKSAIHGWINRKNAVPWSLGNSIWLTPSEPGTSCQCRFVRRDAFSWFRPKPRCPRSG